MSLLLDLLAERAADTPDRPAIIGPAGDTTNHANLHARVVRLREQLTAAGVTEGCSVALALPNGPELAMTFLGAMTTAACAPLAADRPVAEHQRDLAAMGASVLVVQRGHDTPARDAAKDLGIPLLELAPDTGHGELTSPLHPAPSEAAATGPGGHRIGLLLFTSGTTSRPKLVPLSEAGLLRSAGNVAATLRLTADDRCLNVMPLFHVHGIVAALLGSITAGASVVCTPGFVGSLVWQWIDELGPTWYTGVPTIHQAMLDSTRTLDGPRPIPSSLRVVRSSSAALPVRVMAELESVLGVPVIEAYGMTEAAHQIASNPLPPGVRKPGTVGRPTGCEVGVLDVDGSPLGPGVVGEIALRGPSLATGYVGAPDATAAAFRDGWFHTGDQGHLDADGYVTLTGRLKEIINRGGEKVAPREIDDALLAHPHVKYAVAFAVPHPRLGEEVGAAVVLHEGATVTAAQLRVFVAGKLAPFKVPRRVVAVDEIPRNATGKLDRTQLANRLGFTEAPGAEVSCAPVVPVDDLERRVAHLWQEVLELDVVPSVVVDFFELGGDSLHAVELLEAIEATFGRRLPATVFFDGATVRGMTDLLRVESTDPSAASVVPVQATGTRPALFCVMRAGSVVTLRHLADTLGPDQPVFALWMPAMHGPDETAGSIEELGAECVRLVRATRPEGPYLLFGHSLGAVVVFEAARQLAADGHDVATVFMADAIHPELQRTAWARRHSARYRVKKLLSRRGPKIVAWRVRQVLGRNPPRPVVYLPGTELVADWRAALARERAYVPGPAPAPIVIFATRQYLRAAQCPDLGWAPVLTEGWESIEVPGDHDSMIGEPHVHVLAARLAEELERVRAVPRAAPVSAAGPG
jgi:acyl-CoA synthetase (AMP-forming)/AMP-acid ligase II/thioesterase domain-containing protein/acyl carrier protein